MWQAIRVTYLHQPSTLTSACSPKMPFTLWLALKNRLLTKERMNRFNINIDLRCVMCNHPIRSNDHLFSSCIHVMEVITDPRFSFTWNWQCYLSRQFTLGRITHLKMLFSFIYLSSCILDGRKEMTGCITLGTLWEQHRSNSLLEG